MKPISPKYIKAQAEPIPGPLFDEAIRFVNEAVSGRRWSELWTESEEIRENYYGILQTPYDKYTTVMPLVVEAFKAEGWDCFFSRAYDARGPHHCFYVHKKHFEIEK